MNYKIQDVEESFEGRIVENRGNGEFVIRINDKECSLRILGMDSKGIEFILDRQYHQARYLSHSTNETTLVMDGVPMTVNSNTHLDRIVYKNSGGGGTGNAQLALKSQIPGKVVSTAVSDGDRIKKGDIVCTLESMKMQVAVKAHRDGVVKNLKIKEGVTVAKGDAIAEIE